MANFANYDKFYGSLGAVIVLMFWLYITFYIVLLGEINAELEQQTAQDTTDGKEKPIGQRGAFVADHVAGGPEGHERPISPVTANPGSAKRGSAKSRNGLPKIGSAAPS